MSVKEISRVEIEKMSMVDVAHVILLGEKQPLSFLDTFNKVAALKEWEDGMKKSKIAQFYTDLNMDGRFITNGSNTWGLKRWYKLDEISEELTNPSMEVFEDEDEGIEFLKEPSFEDVKDNEDDDEDEEEVFEGFDNPEVDDDDYDDDYDDDEDEDDEDFGEVFDEDDDEE